MYNKFHITIFALILCVFTCSPTCDYTKNGENPGIVEMCLIPSGTFLMGSQDRINERPIHEVYLDSFYIDKTEVTYADWKRFICANKRWQKANIDDRFHDGNYLKDWNGNNYPEGKSKHPVVYISWYAAKEYAEWHGKRLPTEAEWEKAARGQDGFKYSYGNEYDESKANTGNRIGRSTPVGSYVANYFGLSDMTGNVLEWCSDWYSETYYSESPDQNPKGPAEGESRILRGGSWNYEESRCTTTFRFFLLPPNLNRTCSSIIGFRCCSDNKLYE